MRKKNIDKKYANVLIRCFPYIPTRWRLRMNDCGDGETSRYLDFSYSNMFFERLPNRRLYELKRKSLLRRLGRINFSENMEKSKFIQKKINEITANPIYQSAMWFLYKSKIKANKSPILE